MMRTLLHDAVCTGNLEELKKLYEAGEKCQDQTQLFVAAAQFGHLDIIKYLSSIGFKWDFQTASFAAGSGHIHCLKYLVDNGWELTKSVAQSSFSNVECLKYVFELRPDLFETCGVQEVAACADYGWLDSLKFAHEVIHLPWDSLTFLNAASKGHIDCIKYAFENGCKLSYTATFAAARGGHIECLKYLVENGCEVVFGAVEIAIGNHNFTCLKYIIETVPQVLDSNIPKFFEALNSRLTMYVPCRHDWLVMYLIQLLQSGHNFDPYSNLRMYVTNFIQLKQDVTCIVTSSLGLFVCDIRIVERHILRFIFPQPL